MAITDVSKLVSALVFDVKERGPQTTVLYVSYDGILEPLGESQVLRYLLRLSRYRRFIVVSFEKEADMAACDRVKQIRDLCVSHHIKWIPLRYHYQPSLMASLYDAWQAFLVIGWQLWKQPVAVIHLRGCFLGVSVLPIHGLFRCPFIFDSRGFWADEKADRSGWSRRAWLYHLFKFIEKKLVQKSVHTVVLTEQAKTIYSNRYDVSCSKLSVIRTCYDDRCFFKQADVGSEGLRTYGYLGSIDMAYDSDRVFQFLEKIWGFHSCSRLHILTKSCPEKVKERLSLTTIPLADVSVTFTQDPSTLNRYINAFDVCVFYVNENEAIKASCPTKIGEVLACGVPIICNNFNEDIAMIHQKGDIGFLTDFSIDDMSIKKDYQQLTALLSKSSHVSAECQRIAGDFFAMGHAIAAYSRIYHQIG